MSKQHETAIAVYQRAFSHFSRRAQQRMPDLARDFGTDYAEEAEQLALGGATFDSGTQSPALRSLLGVLFQENKKAYYQPKTMATTAALPDAANIPELGALTQKYQELWQTFSKEIGNTFVAGQTAKVQEGNLHALLQRYCWAMPAPGVEDVSLYDFARISAALAVCLEDEKADEEKTALLVGADLSGVQDWLYTLSSSGAARSLRGRSVYLQLLMEVIALDLLETLGLPQANLLYVGGGNFYLLAPISAAARIEAYRRTCSRRLLAMHSGALYVAIGTTHLSKTRLRADGQTIGVAWEQVNRALNSQKGQRFAELEDRLMADAIGTAGADPGGPERVCRVCQRVMGNDEDKELIESGNNPGQEFKCALCVSFEGLGARLSSAHFMALSHVAHREEGDVTDWQQGLEHFGFRVELRAKAGELAGAVRSQPGVKRCYYWDEAPDYPIWPGKEQTIWSFRPLAQCVPTDSEGKTLTFEEIVKAAEGIPRWGVLRMDVDNLGSIFQQGLPQSSLCHVVGLSGLMRLFFEGQVPLLAQAINTRDGQKPRIHLMYAGGDDLFVVGAWSYLPELAASIRSAFSEFACGNPRITISGGISIAPADKYPLYQAARDAGEAEHQAKEYKGIGGDKNALTFLGETMTWAKGTDEHPIYHSYAWVSNRVSDLTDWLDGDQAQLPRSFLQNLRAIDGEWRDWVRQERGMKARHGFSPRYIHGTEPEKTLYLGPWQWHLVYSLKRVGEKQKKEMQESIQDLMQHIVNGEVRSIGFASRWAEYRLRKET